MSSFSLPQSSNSLQSQQNSIEQIENELKLISKPNYSNLSKENIQTIDKLLNSPIKFGKPWNITFYNSNELILSDF